MLYIIHALNGILSNAGFKGEEHLYKTCSSLSFSLKATHDLPQLRIVHDKILSMAN